MRSILQTTLITFCIMLGGSFSVSADVSSDPVTVTDFFTLSKNNIVNAQGGGAGPSYYFYNEYVKMGVMMKNETSETFKGQFGVGMLNASTGLTEKEIKAVLFESGKVELAAGGVLFDKIEFPGGTILPSTGLPGYLIGPVVFPIVKKEGGDWEILRKDDISVNNVMVGIVEQNTCTLRDDAIFPDEIEPGKPFSVYAKINDSRSPDAQTDFQVGIYKFEASGVTSGYLNLVEVVSSRYENDVFDCEIPSNLESGLYDIYITPTNAPDRILWVFASPGIGSIPGYIVASGPGNNYKYNVSLNVEGTNSVPVYEVGHVSLNMNANILTIVSTTELLSSEVFDIQGKCVYKGNESRISFADYPKGLYVLKVETEYGVESHKVIKE